MGISSKVDVVWVHNGAAIHGDNHDANYDPDEGYFVRTGTSIGTQEATLGITIHQLNALPAVTQFTCQLSTGESETMVLTKQSYG